MARIIVLLKFLVQGIVRMSSFFSRAAVVTVALVVLPFVSIGGCRRGQLTAAPDEPTAEEMVGYYSPRSIKLLPFTKPRSFDNDLIPDGIGVSLRTLDAAGDPVKAYGSFLFELYHYRAASQAHRGELIQTWTQPVRNLEDQDRFWERVTDTYEFQLSWEGSPIPVQKRFVLAASFQPGPGGDRLFDEHEFEFRVSREEILNALREP